MPTERIKYTDSLTVTTCWCGTTYALSSKLYQHMENKRDNGERQPDVYCPLGHTWIIGGKGKAELERERADRLERQLANRDETLRIERASHAATKGLLTKARKRAANGVCPACKRSFANVAQHVAHMHPELVERPERELP